MDNETKRHWKAEPVQGPVDETIAWGSDVPAALLRRMGITHIALTPGASYRGFHDSLVNHLGNAAPEIIMCTHEEHAIAVAHGYAKVTGRAMAVAVHSNVGLMHASMAIFNAFCDRVPMLILGATGPMDAAERRPWIDWLHTAQDQAALVRAFLKWDDQPGSVAAIPEAMLRGWKIANTAPCGPVYINLDAGDQETPLEAPPALPDPSRFAPLPEAGPNSVALTAAAEALRRAKHPVILFGRGARTTKAMAARVALAERSGAAMLSDLKAGAMVPTDHPNHIGQPFNRVHGAGKTVLERADVILSLGWIDLGGLFKQVFGAEPPKATILHAGLEHQLHSGWGQEHFALPPVDIDLNCSADAATEAVLAALPDGPARTLAQTPPESKPETAPGVTLRDLARALRDAVDDRPVTFPALARGWPVDLWPHHHPLDFLGKDGGGGVGSGPGLCIGAALALQGSGRLVIGTLGDGDTLMSINALWTAAKYRLPVMFLINNNRSYMNDELHQERVALARGRNPANAWVGQRLDDPAPDFAGLARAQGVEAFGPIDTVEALTDVLEKAVKVLDSGRPCLVDVLTDGRLGREDAAVRDTKGAA
jgi:thiamine pyrophosphate-dependent acetolactate synthase large subunit-like protein